MEITLDKIIKILMKRDKISYVEAVNIIDECRAEIDSAIQAGDFEEIYDILQDYLGLEPDYLEAFI